MTVAASGGSVGIAAYDSFSNNITVAQFVDENTGASGSGAQDAASMACPSYPVLQLIKLQLAPHTIYVSSKADGNLLEACRRRLSSSSTPIASAVDQVVDQSTSRCRIQLEHASIFHYQQVRDLEKNMCRHAGACMPTDIDGAVYISFLPPLPTRYHSHGRIPCRCKCLPHEYPYHCVCSFAVRCKPGSSSEAILLGFRHCRTKLVPGCWL